MDPATCPNPSGAAASLFMAGISALSLLQCEIGDPSIYPDDASPDSRYDFIVVGAGPAGCVVANRLSANRHWKVLLLEAGGNPPFTSDVPALFVTLQNSDIDWKYRTDGTGEYCLGMVDKKCSLTRGKALGGSTALNGMIYFRGHPKDYSAWVDKGNKNWDYEDLIPFFEKAEGSISRRDKGYLHLEPFDGGDSTGELPLLKPLKKAAKKAGYPATLEPKIIPQQGFFNTYGTIRDGVRYSAAKGYLSPVRNRKNLDVVKGAFVTKIILNNKKRAIGVVYEKNGANVTVMAKKEVILSAGVIGSPQLLMLSGIGPKKHLRELGIRVRADLPVGNYLQDQFLFPGVIGSINRGDSHPSNPLQQIAEDVTEYLLDRSGPLSGIGIIKFTGFVNSKHCKETACPDNQIRFVHISKGDTNAVGLFLSASGYTANVASEFIRLVNEADVLVVINAINKPKSRGKLRLVSTDPHVYPRINPNYLADPADERAMLGGIEESMKILKAMSHGKGIKVEPRVLLRDCVRNETGSDSSSSHDDENDEIRDLSKRYWRCALRRVGDTDHHAVGTCRMGPKHETSVVDRHLKVHLVKGLRVIDSSIMPTPTSGSIMGPLIAIAERGASMIIHEYKGDH